MTDRLTLTRALNRENPMTEGSSLYEADILQLSEEQAELLRHRAANQLDWENLAEEIETVGRNELRALHSHLIQALLHVLKAEAWPLAREVDHWRAEARAQRQARRRMPATIAAAGTRCLPGDARRVAQ